MARPAAASVPFLAVTALAATLVRAQEPDPGLLGMSLEDLANVEVTTASRRTQDAFGTPASVHVLTAEDIRRSGARTVPDMLRLIPGVHVAQVNAHLWAVSVRGFNWTYASRLLVMIDGRTVYTSLTAGVDWDSLGLLPEDIERIELVRGSGAAIWGANAVNGVINILTKPALETRGTDAGLRAAAGASSEVFVRHGAKLGRSDYRFSVRAQDFPESDDAPGEPKGSDAWRSVHAAFRLDRELREGSLMLAVDATRGAWRANVSRPLLQPPFARVHAVDAEALDASVLMRWTRRRDDGDLSLQVFHDVHDRDDGVFDDVLHTTEADFKAATRRGRHQIDWGATLRWRRDESGWEGAVQFVPDRASTLRLSAFVQDDVRLGRGLRAIVGTRLDHYEDFGLKVQPQARLAWTSPRSRHAAWGAVTRAVRTPSRIERALHWDAGAFDAGGVPGLSRVLGDAAVRPEDVVTTEAGYRLHARAFQLSATVFRARHEGIIAAIDGAPALEEIDGAAVLVFPSVMANAHDVRSRGAEISVRWQPRPWLTVDAGASWIRLGSRPKDFIPEGTATTFIDGQTPRDQQFARVHFRLGDRASLDAGWEHVAGLASGVRERHDVSLGLDVRLGAHATLRLQGTRLFSGEHVEFNPAEGSYVTKAGPGAGILFNWHF